MYRSLLRDVLHVEVPPFTEARLTEAALNQLVPVEYHADAVVLFIDLVDHKNKPVFGTICEVQLQPDARKLCRNTQPRSDRASAARPAFARANARGRSGLHPRR